MSGPIENPSAQAAASGLRVAVLGAGTVGGEVVRAFLEDPVRLAATDGARLELAAVAVRDLDRARAAGIPDAILSDAPAHLVADPGTDLVVELMGGEEPARTLIEAALAAGKPVVTANKHVLAHHGARLEATARRARVPLRFEAAVGGGIPVLGPLAAQLAAGRVTRVRGIVNGTTNFILTEMASGGQAYLDVVGSAQAQGYAEADPTADVEALDAANKLVILARLSFGVWLDPEGIGRRPATARAGAGAGMPGITGVEPDEIEGATALDGAIRLIAEAGRAYAGGPITASVVPTFLPLADALGRIQGVTNRIEIEAEGLDSVAFSGPGAGGAATANAVLSDLVAIARGEGSTWAGLPPADLEPAFLDPGPGSTPIDAWFALLPDGVELPVQGRSPSSARPHVRSASVGEQCATLFEGLSLDEVRELVGLALPAGADATIYPADLAWSASPASSA
jgi:homoserine dehydrogenase